MLLVGSMVCLKSYNATLKEFRVTKKHNDHSVQLRTHSLSTNLILIHSIIRTAYKAHPITIIQHTIPCHNFIANYI